MTIKQMNHKGTKDTKILKQEEAEVAESAIRILFSALSATSCSKFFFVPFVVHLFAN
jgi:hypothetical protein